MLIPKEQSQDSTLKVFFGQLIPGGVAQIQAVMLHLSQCPTQVQGIKTTFPQKKGN